VVALAATLTELLFLFNMGAENMGFAIVFILIAGFASIFSALRTMNSNINQQYDQSQKIIDLLKEIKEELRKR
jgi:uncharacterized membrane protein